MRGAARTQRRRQDHDAARDHGACPAQPRRVEFDGFDLARCAPHEVPRKGIGYVPQGRGIFPNLTVMENLCIGLPRKRDPDASNTCLGAFRA